MRTSWLFCVVKFLAVAVPHQGSEAWTISRWARGEFITTNPPKAAPLNPAPTRTDSPGGRPLPPGLTTGCRWTHGVILTGKGSSAFEELGSGGDQRQRASGCVGVIARARAMCSCLRVCLCA